MRLTENDSGKTVVMEVGRSVTARLASNPTTGYRWVRVGAEQSDDLGSNEDVKVVSTFEAHAHGTRGLMGAGSMQDIVMTPMTPGRHVIELAYRRPWETASGEDKTFSIIIDTS